MLSKLSRDVIGGLIVAGVGLVFLAGALNMRIGSTTSMGPGYFPMMVAGLVTLIGLMIAARGLLNSDAVRDIHWRPMLAVLGGIAAFAIGMSQFGLIPATIAGVLLSATGDRTARLWHSLVLAVLAGLATWLIFRVGLGLQMPGLRFPSWLG